MRSNSTPHASDGNGAANQAGSFFVPMSPAASFDEQLCLLEQRGLTIGDRELAVARLAQSNYYRLRGYGLTFEQDGRFRPQTSFDDIWDVYELDSDLRIWMWKSIEPIELKARSLFAYHLGRACGPTAHEDPSYFVNAHAHEGSMRNLRRETERAMRDGVPSVRHNMETYGDLPLWAAVEIMTMGTVSQLFGNLNDATAHYSDGTTVRSAIAADFGIKPYYLRSWLRHLTYVRNICGHHGRLYNRVMTTRARLLKRDSPFEGDKEFPTLVVLRRLYERSWPDLWHERASELETVTSAHPVTSLRPMGFPENWEDVLLG